MQFVSYEVILLAVNSEVDLKDVANIQSESSEDATEAKVSPAEQEVDSSEALNAPAPLEDDVSAERDEFVNQASQVHTVRRMLRVVITANTFSSS